MKLHRLFLIALLTTTFAVVGCGDSGGSGDANQACTGPLCDANELSRTTCVESFNNCVNQGNSLDQCNDLARTICVGT